MKQNMKKLWKNEKNEILTFFDLKERIEEEVNAEISITNDVIYQMIVERMVQNGGHLVLIEDAEYQWCRDYSNYQCAERYLTPRELADSLKCIYSDIKGKYNVAHIRNTLKEKISEETELLKRLDSMIQEDIVLKIPGWCIIGKTVEFKPFVTEDRWIRRDIFAYTKAGFYHQAADGEELSAILFTKFSEYGDRVREVQDGE